MILDGASNNSVIDGEGVTLSALILAEGTENITIKNFKFNDHGIRIHGTGHTIENCILNVKGCGIFVEAGANHLTIHGNDIKSDAVGVYLEHSSHHNYIGHNTIHDCGYWFSQPNLPFKLPRLGWDRREGIAVDASQDNVIEFNTITNCAFAGITLYRNCGEYGQAQRKEGANRNIVHGNTITGSKVAIWNKAREWRDLVMWSCTCAGKWVPIWKAPKQPYQQWFNWSCLTTPLFTKEPFRFPIRWKLWIVPDEAEENIIQGEFQ